MKSVALEVARRLVTVSVYDREIHIRRAASAAFQENVGRLVRMKTVIPLIQALLTRTGVEYLPAWYRCPQEDRFLCRQHSEERIPCCSASGRRVSSAQDVTYICYTF